jgi:hypothetical protein
MAGDGLGRRIEGYVQIESKGQGYRLVSGV